MSTDDRRKIRCPECGHVWGAYEDWCHCDGEACRNRGACVETYAPVTGPSETRALVNERDHYKKLWGDSCAMVVELCDLAGAKPEDMHDLWTLHILIRELKERAARNEPLAS